ncbi:MAG: FKBP-type peptidyl-prolyl cis-trans isomerase, partial [archaeon]
MTKGNLVSIEFTGKDVTTGKVFDTTHQDVATKEGILNEKRTYGPVIVSLGMGEILPGLDAALQTMKEGETKTVKLDAKAAFGERSAQLVKVIPLSEFKKHNVAAVPGTIVNANDMMGKVQSVSGGRVRVDFNPDLAGHDVEYHVTLTKTFTKADEKLEALVKKAFPAWEKPVYTHANDSVSLSVPIKQMTAIQQNVPGFA